MLTLSKTQQNHYIRTLFECIIAPQIELEAEYVALLFTVDGMQHPLFRGIPAPETDDSGHYALTRAGLAENRVAYLKGMYSKLLPSPRPFHTNIQIWSARSSNVSLTWDLIPLIQSAINNTSTILRVCSPRCKVPSRYMQLFLFAVVFMCLCTTRISTYRGRRYTHRSVIKYWASCQRTPKFTNTSDCACSSTG